GPEQSADQEVDRDKVGQFVTLNGQFARIRQAASQLVNGERRLERPPPLRVTPPYNKIGVAALVAGAGMHDLAHGRTTSSSLHTSGTDGAGDRSVGGVTSFGFGRCSRSCRHGGAPCARAVAARAERASTHGMPTLAV